MYLDHIRNSETKWPNSFIQSLFELIDLSELYMKYIFLVENGIKSKECINRYETYLARLEIMNNCDYPSFEIIKQYYLGKIYFDVEKNYSKALNKFELLSKTCPNNLIFKKIIDNCQQKINVGYVYDPQSLDKF